jgi:beta-mannosidase
MLSILDDSPRQSIFVSNDLLEPWSGKVKWGLETFAGEVLISGDAPVNAPPQASTLVEKLDFSDQVNDDNMRTLVFIAELWQGEQFISRSTAYFVPIKHLSLVDPSISVNVETRDGELSVGVTSRSLALLVEVSLSDADVVFSDNYFNTPAGRTVEISCPLPAGWTLSQAKEAIRVRSVFDSYSHPATNEQSS